MVARPALKPFRYSGNKSALVQHYRAPPAGTRRIVEPYLGTGAYSLAHDLPALGYEANGDVVAMWHWLQSTTEAELRALAAEVEALKAEPYTPTKPDVRMLDLPLGQQTYVRINAAGVYTGTLSAWSIYPQHRLPVDSTVACLDRLKRVEVVNGRASQYKHQDGDLLFIDPPYVNTGGQYIDKSARKNHQDAYDPRETIALVQSTSNPIIMTYGDGATVMFPDYEWKLVTTRRVPKIRTGGTVERSEWVAYINW